MRNTKCQLCGRVHNDLRCLRKSQMKSDWRDLPKTCSQQGVRCFSQKNIYTIIKNLNSSWYCFRKNWMVVNYSYYCSIIQILAYYIFPDFPSVFSFRPTCDNFKVIERAGTQISFKLIMMQHFVRIRNEKQSAQLVLLKGHLFMTGNNR